jgi:zinc protease
MKRAKDSILNSFVFNYDSKSKILGQQMLLDFYGLPADFLEQYRANIEKVTREDVARVAKKYVHPDQLAILVIGKGADFDKPLSTFGKVTTIDITIPEAVPGLKASSGGPGAARR